MLQKLVEEALVGLRNKLVKLNFAIKALEALASDSPRRCGRPPAWLQQQESEQLEEMRTGKPTKHIPHISDMPPTKRKPFTKATKKKMAAAQKKRWAAAKGDKPILRHPRKKVLTMKTKKTAA